MKTAIINIGNSKGIRIPKALLKTCKLDREVDLLVEEGKIIILPATSKPRAGWEEQFKAMALHQQDALLVPDTIYLDFQDWQW